MSASLYWEPVERKKHDLHGVGAPSSFMDKLERAFGTRCPVLHADAVPYLRGMAAASDDRNGEAVAFAELANAIEEHGDIKISAVY